MRYFGVTAVLAMALAPGCTSGLRFVPRERITQENAGSLQSVHRAQLANHWWFHLTCPVISFFAPERPWLITEAAVDAARQQLYVLRSWGDPVQPTGWHVYDLKTGAHIKYIHIPGYPAIGPAPDGHLYLDFRRQRVYHETVRRQDGAHCVLLLDLDTGKRLWTEENVKLAPQADVGDGRLLLLTEKLHKTTGVKYVDRASAAVGPVIPFPEPPDTFHVVGGSGAFIAAVRGQPGFRTATSRTVLAPGPDGLRIVQEDKACEHGSSFQADLIVPSRGWWIAASTERPGAGGGVCIFSIPELGQVAPWNAPAVSDWKLVPGAGLVVVMPGQDVELCEATSGRLVGSYTPGPMGHSESWTPVTDDQGYYVGTHTGIGVELFAVPTDAPGALHVPASNKEKR